MSWTDCNQGDWGTDCLTATGGWLNACMSKLVMTLWAAPENPDHSQPYIVSDAHVKPAVLSVPTRSEASQKNCGYTLSFSLRPAQPMASCVCVYTSCVQVAGSCIPGASIVA